jgi:hypothetical protein
MSGDYARWSAEPLKQFCVTGAVSRISNQGLTMEDLWVF